MIILINKVDLGNNIEKEELKNLFKDSVILDISVKEGVGTDELEKIIEKMFISGDISVNDELYITNLRQADLIKNAITSVSHVKESIDSGLPEDFYSIDLMSAYSSLGRIIGEDVDDDLVDEIFSKFCMGK